MREENLPLPPSDHVHFSPPNEEIKDNKRFLPLSFSENM